MIHVSWLAPEGCWDQNMVRRLLDGTLYPHGLQVKHHSGYANTDTTALVLPGRYWSRHYSEITEALARYRAVLAFRVSDEEDLFNPMRVEHDNIRWWVQTPRREYPDARIFGVGFPPHFNQLPSEPPEKLLDVFLSAQDTHHRRTVAFNAVEGLPRSRAHRTAGFTQGVDPAEYVRCMMLTKTAPAPSGAVCPDSFRVWEALEAHAVPVVDGLSPTYDSSGFWSWMNSMFPVYSGMAGLLGAIEDVLTDYPNYGNHVAARWMRYKRQLSHWLVEDLEALGV